MILFFFEIMLRREDTTDGKKHKYPGGFTSCRTGLLGLRSVGCALHSRTNPGGLFGVCLSI